MRAAAFAVVLAVVATPAHANDPPLDPLGEAMQLEADLDYDAALVVVEREIARGAAERDRLVTMHLFAGKLAAGLERVDKAQYHFARVAALAPTTTFPDGTSPKITEPFEAVRARTAPLQVAATLEDNAVSIRAVPDPHGIVAGVLVFVADGAPVQNRRGLRVELAPGARPLRVFALDAYGNRVWSERVVAAPAPARAEAAPTSRPLYARWPLWAAGTVVALGAGGVFAWRMDEAQRTFDAEKRMPVAMARLDELEARGTRWALAANISFGVAAATSLVAIITAARGSHTTTIVTARSDQVGIAISGSF